MPIFPDRENPPDVPALEEVLGPAAALFVEIEQHIQQKCGRVEHEWNYYTRAAGWTLALAVQDRRVFHLLPQAGCFTLVFTFGREAAARAAAAGLPPEYIAAIENARDHAEGRTIRFDVVTAEDAAVAKELINLKLS
jgi:hypothetical protein